MLRLHAIIWHNQGMQHNCNTGLSQASGTDRVEHVWYKTSEQLQQQHRKLGELHMQVQTAQSKCIQA